MHFVEMEEGFCEKFSPDVSLDKIEFEELEDSTGVKVPALLAADPGACPGTPGITGCCFRGS